MILRYGEYQFWDDTVAHYEINNIDRYEFDPIEGELKLYGNDAGREYLVCVLPDIVSVEELKHDPFATLGENTNV